MDEKALKFRLENLEGKVQEIIDRLNSETIKSPMDTLAPPKTPIAPLPKEPDFLNDDEEEQEESEE